MKPDDMILVSVDDHVVEPPDMWKGHLTPEWSSKAPRLVHKPDGSDVWLFNGQQVPNIGLNAVVGRPEEMPELADGQHGCKPDPERDQHVFASDRPPAVGALNEESLTNQDRHDDRPCQPDRSDRNQLVFHSPA